jgi:hypothetical protein
MYKFKIRSSDGESTTKFDTLDEFAAAWTNGNLRGFDGGRFVSNYGDVITPDDDFTLKEVKKESLIIYKEDLLAQQRSNSHQIIRSHPEMVAACMVPVERASIELELGVTHPDLFGAYVDLDIGRAFMIIGDVPLVDKVIPNKKALEKIGLPPGSMSLRDTFVVHDKLSGKIVVVDTRKEAESLIELTARAIDKTIVIEASIELSEGFNDDGVYADLSISGDKKTIEQAIVKLKDYCREDHNSGFYVGGYKNSKERPMNGEEFTRLACNGKTSEEFQMASKEDIANKESKNIFFATKITRQMINAAGSTESGINVELKEGQPQFFAEGTILKKLDTGTYREIDFEPLSREDAKNNIVLNNDQKNQLGALPF